MGAGNSTELHQNCTGGYPVNLTGNATVAPLTELELEHAAWIAEYGWIVAVAMALAGCIINNLGSNVQKLSFRFGSGDDRNAKCISVWAAGFILQILGASLDMVALGYGDQSLIAPIAALALVANIGFAKCIHQEHLSCLDGVFMFVIFIGCVVCTISAGKHNCPVTRADIWQRFISWEYFWGYAIAIALIMGVLGTLQGVAERVEKKFGPESKEYKRLEKVHRVGYPIMGGVIGAQGVLIGNAGVTCITEAYDGVGGPWAGWEIFLFIFFAVVCLTFVFLQVAFLNRGLERWDAMLEVPIMQSIWIVFCIIGGGVFFEEFKSFELWQFFVFPLGVCITLTGVGLLAYFRRHSNEPKKVVPVPDKGVAVGAKTATVATTGGGADVEEAVGVASKSEEPDTKAAPSLNTKSSGNQAGESKERPAADVVGTPVGSGYGGTAAKEEPVVVVAQKVVEARPSKAKKDKKTKKNSKKKRQPEEADVSAPPSRPQAVLGRLDMDPPTTPRGGQQQQQQQQQAAPSTPSGVDVEVRLESKLQIRATNRAARKGAR